MIFYHATIISLQNSWRQRRHDFNPNFLPILRIWKFRQLTVLRPKAVFEKRTNKDCIIQIRRYFCDNPCSFWATFFFSWREKFFKAFLYTFLGCMVETFLVVFNHCDNPCSFKSYLFLMMRKIFKAFLSTFWFFMVETMKKHFNKSLSNHLVGTRGYPGERLGQRGIKDQGK